MISILILTKNEEKMIEVCLASAKWADEIILVDSNSTDKTVEIAKKYTDKIFQKEFEGYAAVRNFALEQSKGDWIFYLDADERISAQLKNEILKTISDISTSSDIASHKLGNKQQASSVFAIPRKNILLGKWQKRVGWWPDYQIRLFKKEALKTWTGELHERPEFSGKLGYLKNPLIHLTHRDIISMMQKTALWAPIEAKLRSESGHPKMSWWRFIRVVKAELLSRFLKGGWKDGVEGWIEIFYQAFSLFITYVKLWELQRKESLEETYKKIDYDLIKSNFQDKS